MIKKTQIEKLIAALGPRRLADRVIKKKHGYAAKHKRYREKHQANYVREEK